LPLLFYAVVKDTSWRFLFKRRLEPLPRLVPAA
jgi:hypothetical protein